MMVWSQQWRGAGLCVLLTLFMLVFSAATAFATFPGANGLVTYSAANSANSAGIFAVLPDGSEAKRLTGPHTIDPAWSADGRQLLFVRDLNPNGRRRLDLFIRRADGSHRRVTHTRRVDETDPSFSPSGNRIVFSRLPGEPGQSLVSMRLDGTHRHRLTGAGSRPFNNPEYSPDGKHITYSYRRAIWVARADFSRAKQLTDPPVVDFAPDYSPTGRQIVFERCTAFDNPCRPWTELMRADGTQIHHPPCNAFGPVQTHRAVFAPNGDLLADALPYKLIVGDPRSCAAGHHELPIQRYIGSLDWQPLPTR